MKRLSFIIFTALFIQVALAQEPATNTAINYGSYEKKLQKSDAEIKDPKKMDNPKTWYNRGALLQDIYEIHNVKFLQKGADANQLQLLFSTPKQKESFQMPSGTTREKYIYDGLDLYFEGGKLVDWDETKTVTDSALDKAYVAYVKAIDLDKDKKLSKKIKTQLDELKSEYLHLGSYLFDKGVAAESEDAAKKEEASKYYTQSSNAFEMILKTDKQPLYENVKDTVIIYYTGLTAFKAGDNERAVKYLEEAKALNLKEPSLYEFLADAYTGLGENDKAIAVLKDGFQKFPDNNRLVIAMVNQYLKMDESKLALDALNIAKQQDPTNKTFYFAEGTLQDKLGNFEASKAAYDKALEIDPNYYDAVYNYGVLYFNHAVKLLDSANLEKNDELFKQKKEAAETELKNTLTYMEKAHELKPNDKSVLETLKTLYYRLQMNDKLEAVKKELDALQ